MGATRYDMIQKAEKASQERRAHGNTWTTPEKLLKEINHPGKRAFSVFDKKYSLKTASISLQHLITFWWNCGLNSCKFTSSLCLHWNPAAASLLSTTGTPEMSQPLLTTSVACPTALPWGNGSWAQLRAQGAAGGTARPAGQQDLPSLPSVPVGTNPQRGGENTSPGQTTTLQGSKTHVEH